MSCFHQSAYLWTCFRVILSYLWKYLPSFCVCSFLWNKKDPMSLQIVFSSRLGFQRHWRVPWPQETCGRETKLTMINNAKTANWPHGITSPQSSLVPLTTLKNFCPASSLDYVFRENVTLGLLQAANWIYVGPISGSARTLLCRYPTLIGDGDAPSFSFLNWGRPFLEFVETERGSKFNLPIAVLQ